MIRCLRCNKMSRKAMYGTYQINQFLEIVDKNIEFILFILMTSIFNGKFIKYKHSNTSLSMSRW